MNIENFIESQYRKLDVMAENEFSDLYSAISHPKLKSILITLHSDFVSLFESMNTRLPTNETTTSHFWAESSRKLIDSIDICERLEKGVRNSPFAFGVNEYYKDVFSKCKRFLSRSGGSLIPSNMDEIDIFYTIPIFVAQNSVTIDAMNGNKSFELKIIGEGSYAQVFKYKDEYYQKQFVLKRAKKNLEKKEIERFKREFELMHDLNSPYIVEVFRYNDSENEYIMEFMDKTLDKYITANNAKLAIEQRKNICNQILKAFTYIHSKGLLHRDISPNNVLIKEYDDVLVVKISDFGLVKTPESNLTSLNTDMKGWFNDPSLLLEGFSNYNILHETFALTRLLLFVMTGKTNTDRISDAKLKEMAQKGIGSDMAKRFQNTEELATYFRSI